jgi:hypothetical protein
MITSINISVKKDFLQGLPLLNLYAAKLSVFQENEVQLCVLQDGFVDRKTIIKPG